MQDPHPDLYADRQLDDASGLRPTGLRRLLTKRAGLYTVFASMFALLLVLGVHSFMALADLGGRIAGVLSENYESIEATHEMSESLAACDRELLLSVFGQSGGGHLYCEESRARFERGLKTERGNITIQGEAEAAALVQKHFAAYQAAIEQYATTRDARGREVAYFSDVTSQGRELGAAIERIRIMNEKAMRDADEAARRQALAAAQRSLFLLFLALNAAVVLMLLARRALLL